MRVRTSDREVLATAPANKLPRGKMVFQGNFCVRVIGEEKPRSSFEEEVEQNEKKTEVRGGSGLLTENPSGNPTTDKHKAERGRAQKEHVDFVFGIYTSGGAGQRKEVRATSCSID